MTSKSDWHLWCRLCAKEDTNPKINIFIKNENTQDPTVPESALAKGIPFKHEIRVAKGLLLEQSIEKYFSFKITPEEKLPMSICTECHDLIENFRKFNIRVLKVQALFKSLQQANGDTKMECGNGQLKSYQPELQSIELERVIDDVDCEEGLQTDAYLRNPLELPQIKIKKEEETLEEYRHMPQHEDNDCVTKKYLLEEVTLADSVEVNTTKYCNRIQSKRKKADLANAPYTCKECENKFRSMSGYRVHMKKAHDVDVPPPEYKCKQCNCSFNVKSKLAKHVKMHAPLELRKIIPCPQCNKKFTTKCLMKAHISHAHTDERRFVCDECGVPLRTSVALKRHMVIHTNIAEFACSICGRRFKHKYHLNSHMETHDPTKHVCKECGLELNSRRTLRLHLLVHSNETPHKCDHCGRSFKRLNYLKIHRIIHRIIHTGAKPYSCDFCDLSFAAKTNCRLHMKKLHPQEFAAKQLTEATTHTACMSSENINKI